MASSGTEQSSDERFVALLLRAERVDVLAARLRELQRENAELHAVIAKLRAELRHRNGAV